MCYKSYMHKRSLDRHQRTHHYCSEETNTEDSLQNALMTDEEKLKSRQDTQRRYYIRRKARELIIKKSIDELKKKERNEKLMVQRQWDMNRRRYQAFLATQENPWQSESESEGDY